ncbi:MAG TPA: amidase [Acidimicrobiia bacterium]
MDAIELVYAGAVEQARLVRRDEVSTRELVEATLERIDALNARLNAYRVVFADRALTEADRADALHAAGEDRPLLGVPVAIKDDADVAGEVTAWGTDAFGPPKLADSDVVTRLRAAGAIVIGKTHVPEMTLWPWTASTTWGTARNPWDPERTPGGSSGGSAVATATGMCGVALGSDGGGSIRYPSALTALFGIKPQRDRVPLGPDHHDAWNGLTAYGPLARTVRDAAAFLDATADDLPDGGFLSALERSAAPLRIAVSYKAPPGSLARLTAEPRAALEQTTALLSSLGHEVFEQEVDYGLGAMWNVSVRYVKGLHQDVATMARPERLERNTRRLATFGHRLPGCWLVTARDKERAIAIRMNKIFDRADIVLTPMVGGPPPLNTEVADHGLARSLYRSNAAAWAAPWNAIGQPAASVPAGFDSLGLPLAVQLCGRPNDEATILRLAAQLEEARPWAARRPPVDGPAAMPDDHGGSSP